MKNQEFIEQFCETNGLKLFELNGNVAIFNPTNRRIAATNPKEDGWLCRRKIRDITSLVTFDDVESVLNFLVDGTIRPFGAGTK